MKRLYVLAISICIILLFNICAYADSSIEVSINTDKYQYKKSDTIKMKLSLDKNCGCAGLVIKLILLGLLSLNVGSFIFFFSPTNKWEWPVIVKFLVSNLSFGKRELWVKDI